jgi:formylglycine-generating enzyme required for sulfatase activity
VHDLTPRDYKPEDPRYGETLRAVMDIFDAAKSESVPFEDRLAAAEALGPGGDPRLERDNWVPIPAGSFRMGSNDFRNQKPPYDVYLDAFEIGRFPVTVQEFAKFVDGRGYQDRRWWKHEAPGERNAPDAWQDQLARPNHPVTRVSWFEAAAYCQWLSDYTGRRVRLPTEAEWERAACGGLKRKYPWGDPEPDSGRANFREGGLGGTTPVGLYPSGSSPEGVLDMAGNVWEWVADWYGKYNYQRSPRRNPLGPDSGRYRAFRGGSWLVVAFHLRVSVRIWDVPGFRVDDLGFRCARDVIVP